MRDRSKAARKAQKSMSFKRTGSVSRVFRAIGSALRRDDNSRGRTNENLAWEVTCSLAARGEIPATPDAVRKTIPSSEEDNRGWDIVIDTDRGVIPLQIKSSQFGKKKFEKKRTSIACVIINKRMRRDEVRLLIKRAISDSYRALKESASI